MENREKPNSEQRSGKEQISWVESATKTWKEMEWGERQYWLAQIADEYQLPKMRFVMTHKHFDFDKIPDEYKKVLAHKWGFVESD